MILKKIGYFFFINTLCMNADFNNTDINENIENGSWNIFLQIKHWKISTQSNNPSLIEYWEQEKEQLNAENIKEYISTLITIYNQVIEELNTQSCEVNPQEYYNDHESSDHDDSNNENSSDEQSIAFIDDNYIKYPEISYEVLEQYQTNTEIQLAIKNSIDIINKIRIMT